MKLAPQHRRTARKLVLPAIAICVMMTMMALGSASSAQAGSARVSHELYKR